MSCSTTVVASIQWEAVSTQSPKTPRTIHSFQTTDPVGQIISETGYLTESNGCSIELINSVQSNQTGGPIVALTLHGGLNTDRSGHREI